MTDGAVPLLLVFHILLYNPAGFLRARLSFQNCGKDEEKANERLPRAWSVLGIVLHKTYVLSCLRAQGCWCYYLPFTSEERLANLGKATQSGSRGAGIGMQC